MQATSNTTNMRTKHALLFAAVVAVCSAFVACTSATSQKAETPALNNKEMLARGSYLVNSIGCDDCHSPKRMGPNGPEIISELRFSGYPASRPVQQPDGADLKKGFVLMGPDLTSAVGPWGTSFAANISSDASGIGNWTEAQFLTAIRQGKTKGLVNSRPMLPPMPWTTYRNLSDEDLKAVFAYLKSTAPVQNVVPAPLPPGKM